MNIRFEDAEKRHERTHAFFKFLYYDWGEDEDDDDSGSKSAKKKAPAGSQPKNQGTKEWQIYKDVNQYETKDKFGKQALKRDFYNKHVDQKFNEVVNTGLDDEGMKDFNHYCHFYNSLGIVGYEDNYNLPGQLVFYRRLLYLIYFVTYPLNIPYSWSLVFAACVVSILLPNPRQKNQNFIMNIFEEESMNLSLLLFMAPSGPIMRILINICLMMWALQHVNQLAYNRLQRDPDTVGLSILAPVVQYIHYNKVELNFIKNGFEILLGFIGVPFVFMKQTALIFPILFYQYLKVKNMSNAFQKHIWKLVWEFLTKYAPPVIGLLKLFGFGKDSDSDSGKDRKTDEQTIMDQINEQQKKANPNTNKNKNIYPKPPKKEGSSNSARTAANSTQNDEDEELIEELDTADMKKIN